MKMKIRSLFAAALVLSSGAAFAATTDLQVNVLATIPASNGLDIEDVGGWSLNPQTMVYNRTAETLAPVTQPLRIKSGIGAVTAHLSTAPKLVSVGDSIDMVVSIGGLTLPLGSVAPVEIASEAQALAGIDKQFQVAAAAAPTGGYAPGNYTGIVHMVFDSVAP